MGEVWECVTCKSDPWEMTTGGSGNGIMMGWQDNGRLGGVRRDGWGEDVMSGVRM